MTKYKVIWKGRDGDQGVHKSKERAEKRIGRLVAMSRGKVKREEFRIEETGK